SLFGVLLQIFNNAGTIRFGYSLSSTGAAFDIATNVLGTTLPVVGTYYFVELTFDALAGVYRLYVNGTQEASTASTSRISSSATHQLSWGTRGDNNAGLQGYLDKPEFLPYCDHSNGTVYAVPTVAPSIITVNYASDFFDIQQMKMFKVNG